MTRPALARFAILAAGLVLLLPSSASPVGKKKPPDLNAWATAGALACLFKAETGLIDFSLVTDGTGRITGSMPPGELEAIGSGRKAVGKVFSGGKKVGKVKLRLSRSDYRTMRGTFIKDRTHRHKIAGELFPGTGLDHPELLLSVGVPKRYTRKGIRPGKDIPVRVTVRNVGQEIVYTGQTYVEVTSNFALTAHKIRKRALFADNFSLPPNEPARINLDALGSRRDKAAFEMTFRIPQGAPVLDEYTLTLDVKRADTASAIGTGTVFTFPVIGE